MTAAWSLYVQSLSLVRPGGGDCRNRDTLAYPSRVSRPSAIGVGSPGPWYARLKPCRRHSALSHTTGTGRFAYSWGAPWHSLCCRSSVGDVV